MNSIRACLFIVVAIKDKTCFGAVAVKMISTRCIDSNGTHNNICHQIYLIDYALTHTVFACKATDMIVQLGLSVKSLFFIEFTRKTAMRVCDVYLTNIQISSLWFGVIFIHSSLFATKKGLQNVG